MFFLLLLILSLLSFSDGATNDTCSTSAGTPGTCQIVSDCPSVYRELLAGQRLESLCGYSDSLEVIVCCPSDSSAHPPEREAATTTTSIPIVGRSARPSEQKCSEYARRVYALVESPILAIRRRPVNVSLCAIKSKKLIVGGERAGPREFPHMAAVGFEAGDRVAWLCGGALVSERFVLTAAHCTFSRQYGKAAWVRVGDLNLAREDDDARPQTRRVLRRIRHPDYARPAEYHDIALLELEAPGVLFDAYTRPACLPFPAPANVTDHPGHNGSLELVVATGWGRVAWDAEDASDHLRKVTLNTVSGESCNASYLGDASGSPDGKIPRGIIAQWQICAGSPGRDTCQGDSGGPIVVFRPDHECTYDVVGITSLGRLCGSAVPGVYTRVANYLSWLEKTIWPTPPPS